MRTLVQHDTDVTLRVADQGGNLVAADAPPEVEVRDPEGNVVDSGTSTAVTGEDGVYTYTVPAQSTPDLYTVEATYAVAGNTRVDKYDLDVVEGRLVSLWRVRETIENDRTDNRQAANTLSDDALRQVAEAVEDWFSDAMDYAPYPRADRYALRPHNGPRARIAGVRYPREVLAGTVDGTAFTATELADIEVQGRSLAWGDGSYWRTAWTELHLAHGATSTPADLQRAALAFARYLARKNNLPDRATEVATEGAVFSLAMPSPDRPTGLPEVDAVVQRLSIPAIV